ncbi:hypothetical protein KVT40_002211 [Elsinoe batatas]|uniref:Uncharacterized protein n=1 Tax=Elsinoe batatas TaxID=2601811 RepID=A0A8K0L7F4_9PEZI|nr:hypothetical protein KVT40_002211 [Elsinoe batatas]
MGRNKRRVIVALYHRDQESLGQNRQRLGNAAYHCAILVIPKARAGPQDWVFEVTNGVKLSQGSDRRDLNPTRDWWYRSRSDVDKDRSSHLLSMTMIGKLHSNTSFADIDALLSRLSVPHKDAVPEENCVSWTRAAIETLIQNNCADQIGVVDIMDRSVSLADKVLERLEDAQTLVNMTNRPL